MKMWNKRKQRGINYTGDAEECIVKSQRVLKIMIIITETEDPSMNSNPKTTKRNIPLYFIYIQLKEDKRQQH